MRRIVPHLWFDTQAKEATAFYTSVFSRSRITSTRTITNTPSGDCDIVSFELRGLPFQAISAGPYFKLNPSISFMVSFDPDKADDEAENIDVAWNKLTEGGKILMPIGSYPFSERYGWVEDKYGVSWQLIQIKAEGDDHQEIFPSLLFVGDNCGRAEEAIQFYLDVFRDSPLGTSRSTGVMKYGPNDAPNKEGTVKFGDFKLLDSWFAAMDSAEQHRFDFNEAVSIIVNCDTQEQIDYYWDKLSAVPESEQCGWLKDKFGVSWQIVPSAMDEMMAHGTKEQVDRVTQAFLPMKKFDLATLKAAYAGDN